LFSGNKKTGRFCEQAAKCVMKKDRDWKKHDVSLEREMPND